MTIQQGFLFIFALHLTTDLYTNRPQQKRLKKAASTTLSLVTVITVVAMNITIKTESMHHLRRVQKNSFNGWKEHACRVENNKLRYVGNDAPEEREHTCDGMKEYLAQCGPTLLSSPYCYPDNHLRFIYYGSILTRLHFGQIDTKHPMYAKSSWKNSQKKQTNLRPQNNGYKKNYR